MPSSAPRGFSLLALRLLLLAVGFAIALGALEVGLRLFWTGYYVKEQRSYAQPHPVRGWSNRPDVSVPYGEPEFSTTVTHNRFGYRSRPIEHERTPGRVRVLVLGDSFAYGVGVQDGETFSAQLEALAPQLELINTGVNGYGTGQELLLLRDEGLAFQPDVVIVAFFWNDVANSYKNPDVAFKVERGALRYPEPRSVPPEQIARAAAAAEEQRERRGWLRYSYAYRYLSDRLKLLGYWSKFMLGLPLEASNMVNAQEREQAWQLELALLGEIDRLAREHGAHTLLVPIPEQVQVQPEVHITGLLPEDYQVQQRLHEFADEAGIALLDPLPALQAAHQASGQPLYYLRDRHLLPKGQALLAREILARLDELGWSQPSGAGRSNAVGAAP